MSKVLVIEFSGYIYANANTKFRYFGNDKNQPDVITVAEYIKLTEKERSEYIIESLTDALKEADDGDYTDMSISIEEDN